jgi:Toprim domain-containing protein
MAMTRFQRAKEQVLAHLEDIIRELFGAGAPAREYRAGRSWNVINPWRSGAKPSQMIINLNSARRGGWIDFASGDKGDAIDLVAYAKFGFVTNENRKLAVEWIEERFHIRGMTPDRQQEMEQAGTARQARAAREETTRRKTMHDRVRQTFFGANAELAGTPVDTYLATRGINLNDIPNRSLAFRYQADCGYWMRQPARYPALVTAMVNAEGRLRACHLTFLAADGSGKAPEERTKLFSGETQGLVIRATNGPTDLVPEAAAAEQKTGLIGLTEGIEDALSAAIAEAGLRMWAAGSLSGLLHVPDHDCASGWLIFKDNDWGKPQAAALFDRSLARLQSFGKPVEVVQMPAAWGKDANDALNLET